MRNNQPKHSSGFLLGAILGAAAVFFLATPQGKKIVKIVSENGLEGILNFLNEDETEDEDNQEDVEQKAENSHSDFKHHRFFKGTSGKH